MPNLNGFFSSKLCRDLEDDEYEDLRRANLLAVKAKLHESGVEQEPTTSGLDTHEQLYNHACHLVACKRYEEASKILQQALETAKKNLKADGLSQKEISDEVKPIKAQIKFVNHELGTKDEAVSPLALTSFSKLHWALVLT